MPRPQSDLPLENDPSLTHEPSFYDSTPNWYNSAAFPNSQPFHRGHPSFSRRSRLNSSDSTPSTSMLNSRSPSRDASNHQSLPRLDGASSNFPPFSQSSHRQSRRSVGLSRSNATRISRRNLPEWIEMLTDMNFDETFPLPALFSSHTERLVDRVLRLNRYLQANDHRDAGLGLSSISPRDQRAEPVALRPAFPISPSPPISSERNEPSQSFFSFDNNSHPISPHHSFSLVNNQHTDGRRSEHNSLSSDGSSSSTETSSQNHPLENLRNSLHNSALSYLNSLASRELSGSGRSSRSSSRPSNVRKNSLISLFSRHKRLCRQHKTRQAKKRVRFLSPSWWLRSGSLFQGSQFEGCHSISGLSSNVNLKDRWIVDVSIHLVDYKRLQLEGQLDAYPHNPDSRSSAISTAWSGEILDFSESKNFATEKWSAPLEVDVCFWRKLSPFQSMDSDTFFDTITDGKKLSRVCREYIFMRWKDIVYLGNQIDRSNHKISGFYFCCLSRTTGDVQGYYYDPHNTACSQPLNLYPKHCSFSPSCSFL
ncbi:Vid24 family protein [Schizosaccharomyces cryophilus OY26]|uniref:Vid24 family protein n=1 Tax=Schizosaccharomyces cryophilus (strain OY26 / ATCC MYA-4695 / CBS 11777 / NBRC 106824 / NRRL Y48691) TaxID=653667 RepID=S9X7R9_SCHCR|nr:Vid24 family protein [Schizosaccharomyces cryophilus OY26]EPY53177.1 Vid24 family protein [Schizosaccharomyces cryophilus OY26]